MHPLNSHLVCGYATMALEIREQLAKYNALVVPYGLGGLALSLAYGCAMNGANTKLFIAEIADGNISNDIFQKIIGADSSV